MHIKQYPTVESHYCRKDIQRRYLETGLSIRKMYRMYEEKCVSENIKPQKFWLYEHIFNTEFNLGFHCPKKDQCSCCETYKNSNEQDKMKQQQDYENHILRKEMVRDKKRTDKETAAINRDTRLINFDLQKVLISPKTNVGEIYYSRKLSTYNFTVFDVISKQAKCYMWYEGIGKRGSNEISSCMYLFNQSLGKVNHVMYYSDGCGGQQRNLPFASMCLYTVQTLPIDKITHTFFEKGHSQMEGDSVHATIEKFTKHRDMYCPNEWMTAVANSKITQPKYEVIEMSTSDFKDFKDLSVQTVGNRNKTPDGKHLQWLKVRSFEFRKTEPDRIYFKYDLKADFLYIEISRSNLRRKVSKITSINDFKLKCAYEGKKLGISLKKYKDLTDLCKKGIIPHRYHDFYHRIPCINESGEESD